MKTCKKCGVEKALPSDFPPGRNHCKACRSSYRGELRRASPPTTAQNQKWYLKHHYGMNADDYETLLQEQGGVCAICNRPPGKVLLRIDHSHDTGAVRGLLCHSCNLALGLFQDDVSRLQAAAAYLWRLPNPKDA